MRLLWVEVIVIFWEMKVKIVLIDVLSVRVIFKYFFGDGYLGELGW